MHSVDAIFPQLPDAKNLDAIRWSVVTLIREQLQRRFDTLDVWEALNFANAISMLAMNVNALQQPTTAWLRLCLVDLRYALTPQSQRPAIPDNSATGAPMTAAQLMDALDAVARQLDRRAPGTSSTSTSVFRRYIDRISNVGAMDFGTPNFGR